MRGVFLCALLLPCSCAHREQPTPGFTPPPMSTRADPPPPAPPATANAGSTDDGGQIGLATWYGPGFAGRKTSNGERFDPRAMTAAHRKLPFGTWVEVRRLDTGRTVRVRINDRGPWGDARKIIDLSRRAAETLDMVKEGSVRVEIRVVRSPL
jgi:peptidoglycan lytic transglycosylase